MQKSSNYQRGMAHKSVFKGGVKEDKKTNTYQVRSNSKKNTLYVISKDGKRLVCPCVGFVFNGNCSHVVAVRIYQRSSKN